MATIYGGEAGTYYLKLEYGNKELIDDFPGKQWDAEERAYELSADLVAPVIHHLRKNNVNVGFGELDVWPPSPPSFILSRSVSDRAQDGIPYRDYQRDALGFIENTPYRSILASLDMGLGKSLFAVGAGINIGGPRLIVIPAIIRSVWGGTDFAPGEIRKWLPDADVRVLSGRTHIETTMLDNVTENTWVIVNYEVLDYQDRKTKYTNVDGEFVIEGKKLTQASWLPLLTKIPWKLIVLDEGHAIKKRKSKRTKAILELRDAARTAHRIVLTGTPIHNRPKDLWQMLDWLAPGHFGSFWTFAKRYAGAYEGEYGWVDSGVSNPEELKYRLQWYMMRKTKSEVAHLLPPKMREIIAFSATDADAKAVDKAARGLQVLCASENRNPTKTELIQLQLLATQKKFNAVRELIDSRDGRMVVFLYQRTAARELYLQLAKAAYPVFGIHGEIPPAKREPMLNDFRLSNNGILIATMGVAGLGIDLSCASVAAFLDVDPVPGTMLQCEDRLWRPPQNATVTVYYLVMKGTVDERITRTVVNKLDAATQILGLDSGSAEYIALMDRASGELRDEGLAVSAMRDMLRDMFGG